MGDIFSQHNSITTLQKSLSALARRQQALSNNIANVDTPGYKRSDVNFKAVLDQALAEQNRGSLPLATTDSRHLSFSGGESRDIPVYKDTSTTFRKDGNNVDIENEVVEINKNALMYNTALRAIQNQFSLMRVAIKEGE